MQARNLPIARDYHTLRAIKARGVETVGKAAINSLSAAAITGLLIVCMTILSASGHDTPESMRYALVALVGYMGGAAGVETIKGARSGQGGTNGG